MRDPVGGAVDSVVPAGQHWGDPEPWSLRALVSPTRALAGAEGRGAKDRVQALVDQESEARASP